MKTTASIAAGMAIAAVAFAVGAWTAVARGWGAQTVTAKIINDSGAHLTSVAIAFDTCGSSGRVVSGELQPGASRQLRYSVCGEGGYSVIAVFQNGQTLTGGGGYVETGYVSTERITRDAITSKQSVF